MFIEPLGIQSVPSAISTPSRAAVVTRAVSPYRVTFERGDQMRAVPAVAIAPRSIGRRPIAWIMAVLARSRSFDTPGAVVSYVAEVSHKNSLRAEASMP